MGTCRTCGKHIDRPGKYFWCGTCFFLDFRSLRVIIGGLLTIILSFNPIPDANSIRIMVLDAFYDATNWQPFLISKILLSIIFFVLSYVATISSSYYFLKKFKLHDIRFEKKKKYHNLF